MSSKGFTELINGLGNIVSSYDSESKTFMKKIELDVVAKAQLTTPTISGNLKRSWTPDEPIKVGLNSIKGVVGAEADVANYAQLVEEGHPTTSGGFVQGQWILKKATESVKFDEKVEAFYKKLSKKAKL